MTSAMKKVALVKQLNHHPSPPSTTITTTTFPPTVPFKENIL
jgi:hypothetical protein